MGSQWSASPDANEGGGGPTPDAGADAMMCMMRPHSGNPACDSCGQSMCPNEFAACFNGGGACATYIACFCACSDKTCTDQCNANIDPACASCVGTLTSCQKSKCMAVCGP